MGRDALIELKSVSNDNDVIEYPECIKYLRTCLQNKGYAATRRQVQKAWRQVCDAYCAQWLLAATYPEDEAFNMLFLYMEEC